MPNFTLPDILSPSTVPENFSVMGMGLLMDALHDTSFPLTSPSSI
jgi:hypothetical protein